MKIGSRNTLRTIFLLIHLFLAQFLFAQTEQSFSFNQPELFFPVGINSTPINFNDQFSEFKSLKLNNSISFDTLYKSNELHFSKWKNPVILSFSQEKKGDTFVGLGSFEHYKNNFTLNNDKLVFNFEVGLLKQSTIQNPDNVDFHLTASTLLEYKFNKTLRAYMYGQYISSPLNKNETSVEPFSFTNRLFLQTEIGTGLRASYRNFKTDVGMKTIRNSQVNSIKPINTMDTKITIGF